MPPAASASLSFESWPERSGPGDIREAVLKGRTRAPAKLPQQEIAGQSRDICWIRARCRPRHYIAKHPRSAAHRKLNVLYLELGIVVVLDHRQWPALDVGAGDLILAAGKACGIRDRVSRKPCVIESARRAPLTPFSTNPVIPRSKDRRRAVFLRPDRKSGPGDRGRGRSRAPC